MEVVLNSVEEEILESVRGLSSVSSLLIGSFDIVSDLLEFVRLIKVWDESRTKHVVYVF